MVWNWITNAIGLLFNTWKEAAGALVAHALGFFGLTLISFNALLPQLKAFVLQYVGGLPSWAHDLLGYLGVGIVMSACFSALTIRLSWKVFIVPKAIAQSLQGGGGL